MRIAYATVFGALFGVLVAAAPLVAHGQEEGGDAPVTETDATETPETTPAAEAQETAPEARRGPEFNLRRGFFAESDLGVFLTFGGRNTNDPLLPARSTSNVQPYLGVTLGYDLSHTDSYSFALGLKLAAGYSAGAGRATEAEIDQHGTNPITTRPNDFAVMEVGAAASLAVMMTDRLALTIKVDGGAGIVDPDPTKAACAAPCTGGGKMASEPGAGKAAFAPIVGGGLGVEYFTLLNDFSVGLDARFAMVMLGGAIPGLSISIPIKYTF